MVVQLPILHYLNFLKRFAGLPLHKKKLELRYVLLFFLKQIWNKLVPSLPLQVKLPFGSKWLAYNDVPGDQIFSGRLENEWLLVNRFLKKGMTVIDIGAHHGFYTLLASTKVGVDGKVISFEPSPKEREKLKYHLILNNCSNVSVEGYALGKYNGETKFFIANGRDSGFSSLRRPKINGQIRTIYVPIKTLDKYLQSRNIKKVDFIKIDVEGAELEVLEGAKNLLKRYPRPFILCEVSDKRTNAWNYKAKEIIMLLLNYNFTLIRFLPDRRLHIIKTDQNNYNYNLFAFPKESIELIIQEEKF